MTMQNKNQNQDRAQIHVAGTFRKREMDNYDQSNVRDYIKTMLEDKGILHGSIIVLEMEDEKVTIQVKLHKAAINKTSADAVSDVFEAMDGHIETWFVTESVMYHPEIIK